MTDRTQPRPAPLLTARQVAEVLGVHVSTVWRLTQRVDDPLPVVRFGERITRFRPCDVERLISTGTEGASC